MMLLAIDAGNTNISFAVFDGNQLKVSWRSATGAQKTADDYAVWLTHLLQLHRMQATDISGVIIASVVPEADHALHTLARIYLHREPLTISDKTIPLKINLPNPGEAGADRLVNAFAARRLYGTPAIVVDFGTATTFDVLDTDGAYCGGIIAPGPHLSLHALHHAAAKLPKISITKPERVVGTSTVSAMQSGIYWGYVCLINGLLEKTVAEFFKDAANVSILCTGGLGGLFCRDLPPSTCFDPDLTLKGLQVLYDEIS